MSREILFRAKSIEFVAQGIWIEGFLFKYNEIGDCIGVKPLSANDYGEICDSCYFVIDPDTICRYTGLTDKNGVKIFEGDIILANFKTPFIVQWDREGCRFIGVQSNDNSRHFSASDKYICYLSDTREVIGNVFENPELLKSEG